MNSWRQGTTILFGGKNMNRNLQFSYLISLGLLSIISTVHVDLYCYTFFLHLFTDSQHYYYLRTTCNRLYILSMIINMNDP